MLRDETHVRAMKLFGQGMMSMRDARRAAMGQATCPDCQNPGPHDDNGSDDLETINWCCNVCGVHFDAFEVFDLDPCNECDEGVAS